MVSHDGLVAFWLGCGVDSSGRKGSSKGRLAESSLDAIINRKVYRPCGKVSEDGRAKTSIHAPNTVMSQGGLDDI